MTDVKKQKKRPRVSVVIPCYNHAHFLPEAVLSVLNQTFNDFEIIIVNDGSTDNTQEVAKNLIQKYRQNSIRLINQANKGLAAARNRGIRAAFGEYILPLDADDKIASTMLEKTVKVLDENPKVGVAYTRLQHFGEANDTWECPEYDPNLLLLDNFMPGNSLFRKRVWEEVGGYNENMKEGYEDWDFWIGCYEKGWIGKLIPEHLFLYRKHKTSMLAEANRKRRRLKAQIVLNHPKVYGKANVNRASALLKRERGEEVNRILICCDWFYPSVGGTEYLVEDLGEALIGAGWDVEIATRWMPERSSAEYKGMAIHELNVSETWRGWDGNPEVLSELVQNGVYSFVIAIADPRTWVLWYVPTQVKDTKVIFAPCINKEVYDELERNQQLRCVFVDHLLSADAIIAITERGYDVKFFAWEKIPYTTIPNAVKYIEPEKDFREKLGLESNRPILLNVANFWPAKNQLRFLEEFIRLDMDCYFVLIGYPNAAYQDYYQKITNLATSDWRVRIVPGASREFIAGAMEEATLFLLFSKAEAAPLTILEAMSHHLPWLATPECNLQGIPGGLMVSAERFWGKAYELIKRPSRLKVLGEAGFYAWRKKHSWEAASKRYLNLFERLKS